MGPTRPRGVTAEFGELSRTGAVCPDRPELPLIVLFCGGREKYEGLGIRRPGWIGIGPFGAFFDVDLHRGASSRNRANESFFGRCCDRGLHPGDALSVRRKRDV